MSSGCKPPSQWRIGTEHEKIGFQSGTLQNMSYEQIELLLYKLQARFGWELIMERDHVIGAERDGQSVTLEPGGQLELSGAPVDTLHKTCAEVNSHLYQVKTIAEEIGVEFLGIGFNPKWSNKDVPLMPKERARLMKSYMPLVGSMGRDMQLRTCTIQVNLDFESERDMIDKFRIGLALQPVAVALFANSPFRDGRPTGYLSCRSHVWTDVDAARCGNLPFVFDDDMSFERYADWVMDAPMYFVYRNGMFHDALGMSWRDFMEGKLPCLPGEYPTMADWSNHLTTVFPEVRLKTFLEMRGADGGPWRSICALPALWVGLLYDEQAKQEALELIGGWSQDDRDYLHDEVKRGGLQVPWKGGKVQDLAKQVLHIARGGLERRGHDEAHFLNQLDKVAESGLTQADRMLELYNTKWNGSVDPIYREFKY